MEHLANSPGASLSVAGRWLRQLTSFYLPCVGLAFAWTGPHEWWVAILFFGPLVLAHEFDRSPRVEQRSPAPGTPAWPFDLLVYALAVVQLAVIVGVIRLFTQQGIFSMDMVMTLLVVGASSGFSIITAHELIHRKRRGARLLGRILLGTVFYEHFATEHVRGHHARVGTAEDPATARFGESFVDFFRRTVPGQLKSAWRLETRRLGDIDMPLLDARQLRNRVLHGLVAEWAFAGAVLVAFGAASFVALVAQALTAVALLETVNYFEHWGLLRSGRRVGHADSWDTHAPFTYFGLIGLSRHADHHVSPTRRYQELRTVDDAPVLPIGYVSLVTFATFANPWFQRVAAAELGRRRLGPFANDASAPTSDAVRERLAKAQREQSRRPSALAGGGASLPPAAWPVVFAAAAAIAVFGTALGAHWESGDTELTLTTRVLAHAWVLALLGGGAGAAYAAWRGTKRESIAFAVAAACLVAGASAGGPAGV